MGGRPASAEGPLPWDGWLHLTTELGIRVEGVVREQQPSGLYQVEIEGARRITAHAGAGAERNFVRLLVGDRVTVELTARDMTRGRIVKRL